MSSDKCFCLSMIMASLISPVVPIRLVFRATVIESEDRRFISHPGRIFHISLCGPISKTAPQIGHLRIFGIWHWSLPFNRLFSIDLPLTDTSIEGMFSVLTLKLSEGSQLALDKVCQSWILKQTQLMARVGITSVETAAHANLTTGMPPPPPSLAPWCNTWDMQVFICILKRISLWINSLCFHRGHFCILSEEWNNREQRVYAIPSSGETAGHERQCSQAAH